MPDDSTPLDSIEAKNESATEADRPRSTQKDPIPAWRAITDPYLLKVASKISGQGPKNHSISFPIGNFKILASPLEQELALVAAEGRAPDQEHRLLLGDALGLEIMIAVALRKHEKADKNAKETTWETVEEGLNLGYRLSHAMTIEMRRLEDIGLTDAEDEVQEARNRLTSVIHEAEQIAKNRKAEPQDEPSQDRFVYQWDSSGSASESAPSQVTVEEKRRPEAKTPAGTKEKRLKGLALAVLLIAFALVLAQLWMNRPRELQDFSPEDFPKVPGIEQVVNRSPVLLIIVSEQQWTGADRFEKKHAVESVREIIEPAGYRRAEVRSSRTPNLAFWEGGAKIVINH